MAVLYAAATPQGLSSDHLLQPFAISNLNPFHGVYGIAAMQAPSVLTAKQNSVNVVLDAASHFTDAKKQTESIRIDGESYRLAVRFARGLANQWEIGVEVPVLSHSGGFMDKIINQWHDAFNLPTLGRDRVENDQLAFQYSNNGEDLVNLQSSSTGLGDILLFTGNTLEQTENFAFTIRAQLKLPSGDPDHLLGSGGTDVALAVMLSQRWGNWWGSVQLGGGYLETGDILPELQRNWVGFGSAYLGWHPLRSFAFKLQLGANTPIYTNSSIDQLTDATYQLTFGASAELTQSTYIDVGVTEDEFNPDVSPDVSFQMRLRTLY